MNPSLADCEQIDLPLTLEPCLGRALSIELLSARLQAERNAGCDLSFTLDRLAQELEDQGKYDEAEPLYREALAVQRATIGDRHLDTLTSMGNLGLLHMAKGDIPAAELLLGEALQGSRETLGDRHPQTLGCINNLGMLLKAKGDFKNAESLLREALEVQRGTLGYRHPDTLTSINNLGLLLQAKGDLAAAELLIREAFEGRHETLGSRHPRTLSSRNNLDQLQQALKTIAMMHRNPCRQPTSPHQQFRPVAGVLKAKGGLAKPPRRHSPAVLAPRFH